MFIPPDDIIFRTAPRSQISQLIDLPIVARKLGEERPISSHSQMNNEAASLFTSCELDEPEYEDVSSPFHGFGVAPQTWQLGVGPILVARLDQKPLHILHATALVAFCNRHLAAKFKDYSSKGKTWSFLSEDDPTRHGLDIDARRDVLESITRANFESFFRAYKAKRVAGVTQQSADFDEAFDLWDVPNDERTPRPEWEKVPSPYDV